MLFKLNRFAVFALLGLCCAAMLSLWLASTNRYRENITDLIPFRDGVLEDYLGALKKFSQAKSMFFNVGGDNSSSAAGELETKLSNIGGLRVKCFSAGGADGLLSGAREILPMLFSAGDAAKLDGKLSAEALGERMKFFARKMGSLESAVYKRILLEDPLGLSELVFDKLGRVRGGLPGGALMKTEAGKEKNFLVAAEGDFEPSDSAASAALMEKIKRAVAEVEADFPGVKISYAGAYRIAAENAQIARRDASLCVCATLVLMAGL